MKLRLRKIPCCRCCVRRRPDFVLPVRSTAKTEPPPVFVWCHSCLRAGKGQLPSRGQLRAPRVSGRNPFRRDTRLRGSSHRALRTRNARERRCRRKGVVRIASWSAPHAATPPGAVPGEEAGCRFVGSREALSRETEIFPILKQCHAGHLSALETIPMHHHPEYRGHALASHPLPAGRPLRRPAYPGLRAARVRRSG